MITIKQKEIETKKMKCNHCGYEWNTRSEKLFVCCPNCLNKIKVEETK